jgi:hypothetical protein
MKTQEVFKQYNNPNNGGQERIKRVGFDIMICSNWGAGWGDWLKISEREAREVLDYTKAPKNVCELILTSTVRQ